MLTNEGEERARAAHLAFIAEHAIDCAAAGDNLGALLFMRPLFAEYGPDEGYAFTRRVLRASVPPAAPGAITPATVMHIDPDSGTVHHHAVDDPEVPQWVRLYSQIVAAQSNGDDDTERALWNAAVELDHDGSIIGNIMMNAVQAGANVLRALREQQQ